MGGDGYEGYRKTIFLFLFFLWEGGKGIEGRIASGRLLRGEGEGGKGIEGRIGRGRGEGGRGEEGKGGRGRKKGGEGEGEGFWILVVGIEGVVLRGGEGGWRMGIRCVKKM